MTGFQRRAFIIKVFALLSTFNVNIITSLLLYILLSEIFDMSADFISDRITFRNFNNNILQSYVLNNKHRHSTKVCGEPNHINIATLCIYVLNIIVSHEKLLSKSERNRRCMLDLERAIISFIYQSSEVCCRRSQNVCVYI